MNLWRFWDWLEEVWEIVVVIIVVAIAVWAFIEVAKTTNDGYGAPCPDCYLDFER